MAEENADLQWSPSSSYGTVHFEGRPATAPRMASAVVQAINVRRGKSPSASPHGRWSPTTCTIGMSVFGRGKMQPSCERSFAKCASEDAKGTGDVMADDLTITDNELKTLIAGRLRAMVEGVTHANEPMAFVRTWLLTDMEGVRALVEKLHHGATHTLLTSWPQKMFTSQENAAAVQEVFTERGV